MVSNNKNSNILYKTYKSDMIVLDIETDGRQNILQIAYNMYNNNVLICSKDFYVYDGVYSIPFYPTISQRDIIQKGISPKDASDIVTRDINNTKIIIGHNIISFDLVHITKLNYLFNNKIKNRLKIHDTMRRSKTIVCAQDKLGRLKNPRLEQLMNFLFDKDIENYHNEYGNIITTFECYKVLCDKYHCFSN